MSAERERADGYLATVDRCEPEIHMMDRDATLTSIAISLKRIADALTQCDMYGQTGSAAISSAIRDGMRDGRP